MLGLPARSPPPLFSVSLLMSIGHLIHMLAFLGDSAWCVGRDGAWFGSAVRLLNERRSERFKSVCIYNTVFCCKICVYVHCRHNSQCVLKGSRLCRHTTGKLFFPIVRTRTKKIYVWQIKHTSRRYVYKKRGHVWIFVPWLNFILHYVCCYILSQIQMSVTYTKPDISRVS